MSQQQERIMIAVATIAFVLALWLAVFTAIATSHLATEARGYVPTTDPSLCIVATCRAANSGYFGD